MRPAHAAVATRRGEDVTTRNRSTETITALLSSAPALTPVPKDEGRDGGGNRPVATPPRADNYDDDDLEAFELVADAPLVKPRRRREPDYQTVRINRPTAKILRAQWLLARSIDPMISYTEFATVCVQHGLRALKEQRERDAR